MPPEIVALGAKRGIGLAADATVAIAAAAPGESKRPTFDILAYGGGPIRVKEYEYPVVIDVSGITASLPTPALLEHDRAAVVGQSDKATLSNSIRLSGVVTGEYETPGEPAQKVVSQARGGFKWRASVYVEPDEVVFLREGETATVNAQEVAGPKYIVAKGTLGETSFVSVAADVTTAATIAATAASRGGIVNEFDQWMKDKGFAAVSDEQKKILRAAYDAEHKEPVSAAGGGNIVDAALEPARADRRRQTAIAATAQTLANENPDSLDAITELADLAVKAHQTAEQFELSARRSLPTRGVSPNIHVRADAAVNNDTISAAMCVAGGLQNPEKHFKVEVLDEAQRRWRHGIGAQELLAIAARRNGWRGESVKNDLRGALQAAFTPVRAAGASTVDVSNIVAATANKFMLDGYNSVDQTWSRLCSYRSVTDFKTVTGVMLVSGNTYKRVGPSGEIPHATLSDAAYTNKADLWAEMLVIGYTNLINDDADCFSAIPRKVGRDGAMTVKQQFWTTFLNNSAFFTSARANYDSGAGTALSSTSLPLAWTKFVSMDGPDGKPTGAQPAILLVPPGKYFTAKALMLPTVAAGGQNEFAGLCRVESSPDMASSGYTGYSATAWYLLADPNDIPVIEGAFFQGQRAPTVESAQADFNSLGIQIRGYHGFGFALAQYQGGVMYAGA